LKCAPKRRGDREGSKRPRGGPLGEKHIVALVDKV